MSAWTGVTCVVETPVKLDREKLESIFGMEVTVPDPLSKKDQKIPEKKIAYDKAWTYMIKAFDDIKENPDKYLPCGSEGTLRYKTEKTHSKYAYTIYGALRDYMDPEKVVAWFRKKMLLLMETIRKDGLDDEAYHTAGIVRAECYPIRAEWCWGEFEELEKYKPAEKWDVFAT